MTNFQTQVQELLDREAIRDLPARYCHCVWQNDLIGIVNLFTEDGRIGMGPGENSVRGHEDLLKMYTEALGDLAPRPFIHNHVIQLQSANEAIGTCYVEIAGIRDGESLVAAGYYDDVYHKVNGVWKFQARDVTMHYMTSLREGWADAIMKRAQERAGT